MTMRRWWLCCWRTLSGSFPHGIDNVAENGKITNANNSSNTWWPTKRCKRISFMCSIYTYLSHQSEARGLLKIECKAEVIWSKCAQNNTGRQLQSPDRRQWKHFYLLRWTCQGNLQEISCTDNLMPSGISWKYHIIKLKKVALLLP